MNARTFLAAFLAVSMTGGLAGCGSPASPGAPATPAATSAPGAASAAASGAPQAAPKVEIKIYAPGDRPADMDLVLAEIEKQCPEHINVKPNMVFIPWADLADKTQLALISGEDVDLIFDAPWNHMDQMVSQGMYAILDDLVAQYGPNLMKTRGQEMWDANKWDGHIVGIPFGTTFGGSRSYHIRKDIRESLGIPPISSHQDLLDFLYAVRDQVPGVLPFSMDKNGSWANWCIEQQNASIPHIINQVPPSGLGISMNFVLYTEGLDNPDVKNIFDNPNETIMKYWKEARQLYLDGVINPDVLADNRTGEVQFNAGKVACYVSNNVTVNPAQVDELKANVPQGEIETFSEWVLAPGHSASDFKLYNFQCVPVYSKNKERSIQFLDWACSSQEVYDLFAYGIKGVNWEPVGEKQYKPLGGYGGFPYGYVIIGLTRKTPKQRAFPR
jgi:putative aldouronate transport system substrate-binding protein